MSKYDSDKYTDVYFLLDCIYQYGSQSNLKKIQYEDLKDISSDIIKNVSRQEDKENLKTLVQVIFEYIEGRLSDIGFRFYLDKQFGIPNNKIAEMLSNLNQFRNKVDQMPSVIVFEESFNFPKVSIIITTYNRKEFLIQAINSLLAQDYPNIAIIVIDDSSTDGTDTVMKELSGEDERIIYMRKETNCGPGNNRREAFEAHANGEYIFFLDDDDYLIDTNYLSKAVNFHINHPEVSFVAANVFLDYSQKNQLKVSKLGLSGIVDKSPYLLNFEKKGFAKPVSTLTTLFKRSSLIEMDILGMNMVNDASIYLRSLLVGHAGIIDSIVGVYRIHGNNITFSLSKEFLVENLNEKKIVKEMAVEKYGFNSIDIENWYNYTVYTTISYYFHNSAKVAEDFKYIYTWAMENSPHIYKRLRREFRFVLIKKRLSKFPLVRKLRSRLKS